MSLISPPSRAKKATQGVYVEITGWQYEGLTEDLGRLSLSATLGGVWIGTLGKTIQPQLWCYTRLPLYPAMPFLEIFPPKNAYLIDMLQQSKYRPTRWCTKQTRNIIKGGKAQNTTRHADTHAGSFVTGYVNLSSYFIFIQNRNNNAIYSKFYPHL